MALDDRWRGGRGFARVFVVVAALLFTVRAALPWATRRYVLSVLNRSASYGAAIEDIDLNLWRGAYELEGVVLDRLHGGAREPFLEARLVDLSIHWLAAARGRLVGEVVLHEPVLQATLAPDGEQAETGDAPSWQRSVGDLFPFRIDRFAVRDGELHLRSLTTDPEVDVFVTDVYVEVLNLTNVRGYARELVATAEAAGRPLGVGELEARLRFDPLAEPLRFDLDAELRGIPVVELNDFFRAYGDVDAEAGTFSAFAEFAAADGRVDGYVKTLFEGLQVLSLDEIDDPGDALELVWEGLVDAASEVLENQRYDRLATKIPLRGELGQAHTDIVAATMSLLRNALVAALRPAIDHSIRLEGSSIVEEAEE